MALAPAARGGRPRDIARLDIFRQGYPRVFLFRASEGPPSRPDADYREWSATFGRLMGMMGKCLALQR
jgi:hypothetical protein